MNKVIKLANEFDEKIKKEAGTQLVLGTLGAAWAISSLLERARSSTSEFSSTKAGVQKAVSLASKLKVKTNQAIIDRFIKNGNAIIPLFDVMQNITKSEPSQELINQLDAFIRNVSNFINDSSAIEQVIKENSTWYERVGQFIEDQLGMGFSISTLKSFGYLMPQLIPALSVTLSNASAAYNSLMEAIDKAKQDVETEAPKQDVKTEEPKQVVSPIKNNTTINSLFEDFADIGV